MTEQAPPVNILEARMQMLLRQRVAAKAQLDKIDGEIGKLDMQMSRPLISKVRTPTADLDRDAMYRRP